MTASYGWGVVPVVATIGETEFATSLFPRDGSYLLPVKRAVQHAAGVGLGDRIAVAMRVGDRTSVAQGKSVSVRVDLGGPRHLHNKTQTHIHAIQHTHLK